MSWNEKEDDILSCNRQPMENFNSPWVHIEEIHDEGKENRSQE